MANKKRDRNGYNKQLGRYRLNREDILAIEKILRIYADAREMKHAGISALPDGQSHMPRKYVDRYIKIGKYAPFHLSFGWREYWIHFAGIDWLYCEDSVKFLAQNTNVKFSRYLQLAAWPGIQVTFTPLSTTIYAQTHYATGNELRVMRRVVMSIEDYLSAKHNSYLNSVNLKK